MREFLFLESGLFSGFTLAFGSSPCTGANPEYLLCSSWRGWISRTYRMRFLCCAYTSRRRQGIRIGLTPASGNLDFGIVADQIDYDALMRTEMEDDLEVPQLGFVFDAPGSEQGDATETEK
jgi:hypothetical protein